MKLSDTTRQERALIKKDPLRVFNNGEMIILEVTFSGELRGKKLDGFYYCFKGGKPSVRLSLDGEPVEDEMEIEKFFDACVCGR